MEVCDVWKIRECIFDIVIDVRLCVVRGAMRIGSDWWWWIHPGNDNRFRRLSRSGSYRGRHECRHQDRVDQEAKRRGAEGIQPLPPGEYKVSVSATGFQTLIQEKVIVDALSAVSVNLSLKVGNVSDTVTVADAPAQLNTTDARLGTTIRNELYTNLPLAMGTAVAGSGIGQGPRNPGAFIFLLPGVSEGNRWGTINGAQGFSKDVFIEGVPITDPIQQGEGRTISLGISVEAVEQFQVETSGTGVEFNGQGSENYTIKSG